MAERVVLHLDMDAFYASVEQREDPSLAGEPVIVGADPEGGEGRGVVAAASYEARRFGVHSAQPISVAWRRCPEGVYLRPRHDLYAEVSDRVFDLVASAVDVLEPASIDEAYADVTERVASADDPWAAAGRLAEAIRRRIRSRFDLTCSVGVAPSKLVAKIASDLDKPDGCAVVRPGEVADVMGPLDADVIPGVGPKTADILEEMGIATVADLAAADARRLEARLGAVGPALVARARGEDDRPVDPEQERKSVGAERTFREDRPPAEVPDAMTPVLEEALERLHRKAAGARTVTLKVRTAGFDTMTRARTLPAATDRSEVLARTARAILAEDVPLDEPVRLVGVRFSGLVTGPRQAELEDWPAEELGEAQLPRPPVLKQLWRFEDAGEP